MKYIVDISQKQAEEIESFVKKGHYNNFAQFITTAIENQIYIEKTHSVMGEVESRKIKNHFIQNEVIRKSEDKIALVDMKKDPRLVSMPTFQQLSCSLQKIKEENCWLWGQVNKILPIKIGLRVLYTIIGYEQWIDLEEYRNKAADTAAEFGAMVREYEDKKSKIRDERISAGLPEEKELKSRIRYKAHFLACMRKNGKLDGAMPFLRFVNLNNDRKGRVFIGLTRAGLNFAKLENPVIDHQNFERSLSEKEIDFYLDHVAKNVKGESSAIKWVLNKLANGIPTRWEINKELKKELDKTWNVSDAVINTQRAGLMARMFDLGLIKKTKKGIYVSYIISKRGMSFLEKYQ